VQLLHFLEFACDDDDDDGWMDGRKMMDRWKMIVMIMSVYLCMCTCLVDRFHDLTGRLLLEVRRMQTTAPESFYSSLRADLSLDFVTMMKFTRALSSLGESIK